MEANSDIKFYRERWKAVEEIERQGNHPVKSYQRKVEN